MGNEKNKMNWARIISSPRIESSGDIYQTGERSLPRALGYRIGLVYRRIRRKEVIGVLITLIGSCILGLLIAALLIWLIERTNTAEAEKPETKARYSSSEKETKRDFKLCVVNGMVYRMNADGTFDTRKNHKWKELYFPPKWLRESKSDKSYYPPEELREAIISARHNRFLENLCKD